MRWTVIAGVAPLVLLSWSARVRGSDLAAYVATRDAMVVFDLDGLSIERKLLTIDVERGFAHGPFALHPTRPLAYLASVDGVDVFDLSLGRLAGTIALPSFSSVFARELAFLPDGVRLLVLDETRLYVTDTNDGRTLEVVSVGPDAVDMALSADGTALWVLNKVGRLFRFSTQEGLEFLFEVSVPLAAGSLALSSDDELLLISLPERPALDVIDRAGRYRGSIVVDGRPAGVAFVAGGYDAHVVVHLHGGGGFALDRVDAEAIEVEERLPLAVRAEDIALGPDGRLFLRSAHADSCSLTVVDPSTGEITDEIDLSGAIDVHFAPPLAKPTPTPTPPPVVAPPQPCAYLSHDSDVVSVVDVAARRVLGVIRVPQALHMAPGPSPSLLFASSTWGRALTPIDLYTSTALESLPILGGAVGRLEAVPGTTSVVATIGDYGSRCHLLGEIDLASGEQRNLVGPQEYVLPIAIEPQARFAYALDYRGNRVEVVAWPSLAPLGEISTNGYKPSGIAFHPTRALAYVVGSPQVGGDPDASWGDRPGAVTVVDTATHAAIGEVPTGNSPLDPQVSPDGALLYVANANSRSVTSIDTESATVRATIPIDSFPISLAFVPDGSVAMVSGQPIAVIDTATDAVVATIPIHEWAHDIVVADVPGGCAPPAEGPLPTPTPTFPASTSCVGDCNGNGRVTVEEIVLSVLQSHESPHGPSRHLCPSMRSCPGAACVGALRAALRNALSRCTSHTPTRGQP